MRRIAPTIIMYSKETWPLFIITRLLVSIKYLNLGIELAVTRNKRASMKMSLARFSPELNKSQN